MYPRGQQDEYRDVFLVKRDDSQELQRFNRLGGALHMSDHSLDFKLAQMANKAHRGVVVPLDQVKETAPNVYERRQLNRDGTWKDKRYGSYKRQA